jgi:hypothetical protein
MSISEDLRRSLKKLIFREIWGLPPLLPVKFGTGLLLQYVVNK